jgi:hypothetical protein
MKQEVFFSIVISRGVPRGVLILPNNLLLKMTLKTKYYIKDGLKSPNVPLGNSFLSKFWMLNFKWLLHCK